MLCFIMLHGHPRNSWPMNAMFHAGHVESVAVASSPVTDETIRGLYLWLMVGVSVGVVVITLTMAVLCLCLRRRAAVAKATPAQLEPPFLSGYSSMKVSTCSESSSESPPVLLEPPRRMCQSLSIDIGQPFYVRKHSIQPRPYLARWNSMGSQRCSVVSLGTVQPDLYRSSDSEDPSQPPSNTGRLWFSSFHSKEENELRVTLIRAKYLPGRGLNNGARDPFVKIFLLPDEENFHQSKVRKRTLAPKFNETFNFKVSADELPSRCLRFSVYDVDKRKVRHCLGHAIVSLAKSDVTTDTPLWRDLEKTSQQPNSEGDLQVSIMCNPYSNRLKVTVCKAENVQGVDSGEAYVYTKVQLYHGRKLIKSKRTASQHVMGTSKTELIFHETFTFSVPARFYESCFLQFVTMVAGGTPLVKDIPHGKVTIGPFLFSRGEQLLHWQEMITNPRSLVTRWHKLEPAK